MRSRPSTYRFHVEVADGRRSNEWLLVAEGRNDADLYLAPRSMFGQIKVSMHESGHCQLGPTSRLRDRITRRFRSTAEVWQYDRHTLTSTPAFAIAFRDDHLVALADAPHPDSVRIDLGDDQELWVLLMIQPTSDAASVDYQPLQRLYELQLGDGTALHVIVHRQESDPRWLEAIASFGASHVAEYPMSLSGDTFAYVMAEREGIDHIALEVAGRFLEEQGWAAVEAVPTDRKTTEEHAMEHLTTAIAKLEAIRGELENGDQSGMGGNWTDWLKNWPLPSRLASGRWHVSHSSPKPMVQ